MVTALLEYILYIVPWSFTVGRVAILCCALLYWILSWASLSFYRALAVFVFSHSARIARRQHHFLHLLLLTCCFFLIINPITLFFLDFQLTFGITVALGLFNYAAYKPFI
jgi:predicted membrane metal-binding protein